MLCDNIDGDHMDCMAHHIDHFINHSVDNRQKSTDTTILAYIICSVHVCLLMMYP